MTLALAGDTSAAIVGVLAGTIPGVGVGLSSCGGACVVVGSDVLSLNAGTDSWFPMAGAG